jgi:DNA-binding IclR family transcriptional regulator
VLKALEKNSAKKSRLTLNELSNETGMTTSSLHRYLETLDHVKIVEKTKQGVGIGEKATSYMIHWLGSQA